MARRFVSPDADASLAGEVLPEALPTEAALGSSDDAPPSTRTEQPAGPELLTPNEWAARKGLLVAHAEEPHAKGFHASAEQLYGWKWHAQNFQASKDAFRLSEADYDAALAAAGEYPAVPAHEPAFAPHYPKPIVPEHIAKACAAARAPKAEEKKG